MVVKDATFQGALKLLEEYVLTQFHPYLLNKAWAERAEESRQRRLDLNKNWISQKSFCYWYLTLNE